MASLLGRFRVATTGGRSVGNADFIGRPTLFAGWASWDASREALPEIEAFHLKHAPGIEVCSVAFDVEGPGRPMRYYAAALCSHTPLIDASFVLCRAWDVKSLPFWILCDARGVILARGGAFSARAVEAALRKGVPAKGASAKAAKSRFERGEFLLQTAGTFLSRARIDDAVRCVADAERLDPSNTLYRPQRLALAHADRFYKGPIDAKWLKAQR